MLESCRACKSQRLVCVLELGDFSLSGVFPEHPFTEVSSGPLDLFLCQDCTLVQLGQTFPAEEMYGDNYGYRSGLNKSMIDHLEGVIDFARSFVDPTSDDLVLDIGSNDGTLLRHWGNAPGRKLGIDPTSAKFRDYYDEWSEPIADFFSASTFGQYSDKPAKVITSIAMLYDLEDPVAFSRDIAQCLDNEGVWISEQSYMPWMVLTGAYDTVCHEHIEYYSLTSLESILKKAGLRVLDAQINDANGGSIRLAVVRQVSTLRETDRVDELRIWEAGLGLESQEFFRHFSRFVAEHGNALRSLIAKMRSEGKRIGALGASTKGSIVMQHASITATDLSFIGDVNPFKYGRYMANSDIPIVEESQDLINSVDVILVLPWHFKETFSKVLKDFTDRGGEVIWPLPAIVISTANYVYETVFEIERDFPITGFPLEKTQYR